MADDGGEVAGFAVCELTPDALHLVELDVRRQSQGRGLGRALVEAVFDLARGRGRDAVTLTTFADIAWNAPFYGRMGFGIVDPPDARLAAILAREAARGLKQRCAMRRAV